MGVPEDEIDAALHRGGRGDEDGDGDGDGGGDDDDVFAVWPANERSLDAFLRVRRQWRLGPVGGVMGFDYTQVEALLRMHGIEIDTALLDDLAVMEGAAVDVWAAKGGK